MNKLNDFLNTSVGFTIGILIAIPVTFAIVGLSFAAMFKLLSLGL